MAGLEAIKNAAAATEVLHCVADQMCGMPQAKGAAPLPREPILGSLRELLRSAAAPSQCPTRDSILAALTGSRVREDVAGALADACMARRDDIRSAAGGAVAASVSRCRLVDHDFRAVVSVASDKCVAMNRPSVAVSLALANSGEKVATRNLVFEADEHDLESLIANLERADAAISELKVA